MTLSLFAELLRHYFLYRLTRPYAPLLLPRNIASSIRS